MTNTSSETKVDTQVRSRSAAQMQWWMRAVVRVIATWNLLSLFCRIVWREWDRMPDGTIIRVTWGGAWGAACAVWGQEARTGLYPRQRNEFGEIRANGR